MERQTGRPRGLLVVALLVDEVLDAVGFSSRIPEDARVPAANGLRMEVGDDRAASRPEDAREFGIERREGGKVPGGEAAPGHVEAPR